MIIVLDSNIWLKELGLNSALGAVTRFYVRRKNARLALPEVVRREVEHNFRSMLQAYVSEIDTKHRQLLTMFGSLKAVVLPDQSQIDAKVGQVFANLGVDIIEVPFSLESARSSFLKTITKTPPSDRTQEFKDGVLWADCCQLLSQDDVCLVTIDKHFYAERDYARGLAGNLLAEVSGSNRSFKIFSSLDDVLKELETDLVIDDGALLDAYLLQQQSTIDEIATRNGFMRRELLRLNKTLYVTEMPSVVYLHFTAEFRCEDISGEGRVDGLLVVRGNGSYNLESRRFENLNRGGEDLSFRMHDGADRVVRNIVVGVGNFVMGQREVVHTVRRKLE